MGCRWADYWGARATGLGTIWAGLVSRAFWLSNHMLTHIRYKHWHLAKSISQCLASAFPLPLGVELNLHEREVLPETSFTRRLFWALGLPVAVSSVASLLGSSEKAIWGAWPSLEFTFTSLPMQLEFISSAKGLNLRAKYLQLGLSMRAVILMEKDSGLFS